MKKERVFFIKNTRTQFFPDVITNGIADNRGQAEFNQQAISPNSPVAAKSPAVTKRESPGRKNPAISPVSEKIMAMRTAWPPNE